MVVDILGRWILPLVLVLSALGIAVGGYELSSEIEAQRGIDSHPQRVTGTLTRGSTGIGLWTRESSTVTFTVDGRQITTGVHDVPADVDNDASVCLEVDAQRPLHARLCGTRGGLDDARRELLIVVVAFIITGTLWGLYRWRRRIERRRSEHPLSV
jgi:hypothetical protein